MSQFGIMLAKWLQGPTICVLHGVHLRRFGALNKIEKCSVLLLMKTYYWSCVTCTVVGILLCMYV